MKQYKKSQSGGFVEVDEKDFFADEKIVLESKK